MRIDNNKVQSNKDNNLQTNANDNKPDNISTSLQQTGVKKMPRDTWLGRQRTTPAVQVYKLVQHSIIDGIKSPKSRRLSSCKYRRKTGAGSKNPVVYLAQLILAGKNLVAKDSDLFGHEFSQKLSPDCSINTFQKTGQMKKYFMSWNSETIAKEFKKVMLTWHYT